MRPPNHETATKVAEARTRARKETDVNNGVWYYTIDEIRVAHYLTEITGGTVGAGLDPIGFLIASHNQLVCRGQNPS